MLRYYHWVGITRSDRLYEKYASEQINLFENAKSSRWDNVLDFLFNNKDVEDYFRIAELLYSVELDHPDLNTLLHYTALTNADIDVTQRLVEQEIPRTRRNAKGQRPIDIAREKGYEHLYSILEPEIKQSVSPDDLQKIERFFHQVIMERAGDLIEKHSLLLPQLEMLLELDGDAVWFPIIGMYGGFRYWLETDSLGPALLAYSECRVVGGSEQMHKITDQGSELVAEMDEAIKMLDKARNISGKKI